MNKALKKFFIFAGELSADMHGARVMTALKKKDPDVTFLGVGGPEIRSHEIALIEKMENFNVMGFSDVISSFPRLLQQYYRIRNAILKSSTDAVLFIDSPSLSLRMAESLRKKGYRGKIIQYISPTVWAWGNERIKKLEKNFDLLLTIYPFEKECYRHSSLPVTYVGNPLMETMKNYRYDSDWTNSIGIKHPQKLIALFPGSRHAEIKRNLPKLLEVAKKTAQQHPIVSFGLSCAHDHHIPMLELLIQKSQLRNYADVHLIPKKYSYELMKTSRCAIAKSGTVTLELALHHCPTVVVYELTLLNRLFAKYFLKLHLPHYCIVNILKGSTVFPELIENGFTVENLHVHLMNLFEEGVKRDHCLSLCRDVQNLFQEDNTSEQVAQSIQRIVSY